MLDVEEALSRAIDEGVVIFDALAAPGTYSERLRHLLAHHFATRCHASVDRLIAPEYVAGYDECLVKPALTDLYLEREGYIPENKGRVVVAVGRGGEAMVGAY